MPIERTPPEPEPVPSLYTRRLRSSRIYANDLDALLEFLRKRCDSLTVRVGDHATIRSAAELAEATWSERRDVRIQTSGPSVSVSLAHTGSRIQTDADSQDARSLVDDTYEVLTAWRTLTALFSTYSFLYIFTIAIIPTLIFLPLIYFFGEPGAFPRALVVVFCILFVPFYLLTMIGGLGRCAVSDRTRRDARERTGRLAMSFVTALVGGVAGSLLTFALTKE